jgi:hypothetical protein
MDRLAKSLTVPLTIATIAIQANQGRVSIIATTELMDCLSDTGIQGDRLV